MVDFTGDFPSPPSNGIQRAAFGLSKYHSGCRHRSRFRMYCDDEERQRTVLTNAQNMIVARNLHVLDVRDADEAGRPMRGFGRIFYTEGEKLDFYAYDLDDPGKIATTGSFYVWGEKPGAAQKVVSLGRFHIDSEPDGRWLLRVTDPHLLSQVTSVFVTFEPKSGGVMQPTGRRILTRLLTTEANHP